MFSILDLEMADQPGRHLPDFLELGRELNAFHVRYVMPIAGDD